jgi:hypothetical protein
MKVAGVMAGWWLRVSVRPGGGPYGVAFVFPAGRGGFVEFAGECFWIVFPEFGDGKEIVLVEVLDDVAFVECPEDGAGGVAAIVTARTAGCRPVVENGVRDVAGVAQADRANADGFGRVHGGVVGRIGGMGGMGGMLSALLAAGDDFEHFGGAFV